MSLLDDVSIVVTPNGYKAGELYAVIPVPTEGAEAVTNGDFATDSDWSTLGDWEISGGSLNIVGGINNATQSTVFEIGKYYKFEFDIVVSSGYCRVYFGSSGTTFKQQVSASGHYVIYGTAEGSTLTFRSATTTDLSIDNVSVKEYTSADMDVTRATAATRVDENGLVNYAEIIGGEEVTNGDFATDSDWSKQASWSIANGKASYNGVSNGHRIYQNIPLEIGKTYTASLDILDSSGNFRISVDGGTASYANYTSGDGTYIFEFTSTAVEFSIRASMGYGADTISVDNVSVKEVTRDNVPRIDYTGGGCPHILAEPQRTNLALNSETFSSYNTDNVNISSSSILSPDGASTAIKLALDNGTLSSNGGMSFIYSSTAGETLSWSMFVKKAEYRYLTFSFGSGSAVGFHFDLDTGLITQDLTNAQYTLIENKIESFNNGWYRISVSLIDLTGSSNRYVCVKPSPILPTASNNNYSSTGDGTSGVYVWGSQLEVGSYPTSYIPTSGSTVTRNQDIFTRDGIGSLINSAEGVLFLEVAALSLLSDVSRVIMLTSSDGLNYVNIYFQSDGRLTVYNNVNGVNTVLFQQVLNDITLFNKCALKWGSQGYELWVNGIKLENSTSTSVPIGLSEINFNWNGGIRHFYGKVKQLQVYDTSLSDTQLAALTS
jgi:hypothetical protein